jgi:hypothetical protein
LPDHMRSQLAATLLCFTGQVTANCDVSCIGVFFSDQLMAQHAEHAKMPVCGHESCPPAAPFIGLDNFGCSDQRESWDGKCCNQNTCDGPTDAETMPARVEPPLGSCDVSCIGVTFNDQLQAEHAEHAAMPVCGHEGCGKSAPFVGLSSFGCSDQPESWGGDCCNQDTCDGITQARSHAAQATPVGAGTAASADTSADTRHFTAGQHCSGPAGRCNVDDLQRRSEAVTLEAGLSRPHPVKYPIGLLIVFTA